MKNFALFIFGILLYHVNGIAQELGSHFEIGGIGSDKITAVRTDSEGSIYLAGSFSDTVDFDQSVNENLLYTPSGTIMGFVAKYDSNQDFVWVKGLHGNAYSEIVDFDIDNAGNVYATGLYRDSVDFDHTGNGLIKVTPQSNLDFFVFKLNSSGNFGWVKTFGDTLTDDVVTALRVDGQSSPNINVIGSFANSVDFDPSASGV